MRRFFLFLILFVKISYSQTSYLSFPQQLCQDDLFKPISICLNDYLKTCETTCISGGADWIMKDWGIFIEPSNSNLYQIAQIISKNNSDISKWCTQITFVNLGIYNFNTPI
jgi:hypothetical protein